MRVCTRQNHAADRRVLAMCFAAYPETDEQLASLWHTSEACKGFEPPEGLLRHRSARVRSLVDRMPPLRCGPTHAAQKDTLSTALAISSSSSGVQQLLKAAIRDTRNVCLLWT